MPQFESEFEQSLYRQRQEKLEQLKTIGQRFGLSAAEAVYPNRFPSEAEPLELTQIPDLLARYDSASAPVSAEQLEADRPEVAVAGRLMSHRLQGKAGFAHLQGGGKRLQLYIRKDDVGDDAFALYKLLDLGDHIGVRGILMRTRTGELTVKALPFNGEPAISFLAKAMLALPDKYHGLEDVELRYRRRYVDLIMNSGTLAKAEPPLTKVDPPLTKADPPLTSNPSSRPERSEVERPAVAGDATLPPGVSLVTDTALPNNEHDDAPRNVREVFVKRAAILRAIRKFFDERGFLEVETPMMHTVAGGAAARPFTTHHIALGLDLSLRIAPELYLKRLVVGGMDRVYEINRNFRNEGVSTQHNPEFTMLEFYQAYSNYEDLMEVTKELIEFVAVEVNGTTKTRFPIQKGPRAGGVIEIDLANWQKLSMREATIKWWPSHLPAITESVFRDATTLRLFLDGSATINQAQNRRARWEEREMRFITDDEMYLRSVTPPVSSGSTELDPLSLTLLLQRIIFFLDEGAPLGKAIAELFESIAEPHLIQPTIIYDFPLAVSPLSKPKPDEPDWVERFEFYIGGFEVGNAFSELNDPLDQERRFEAQLDAKAKGDEEAMAAMDTDYVRALGYGLPPTAGEGIGIDRLTMLLTGSRSIRDVILFPLMRPKADAHETPGDPANEPS